MRPASLTVLVAGLAENGPRGRRARRSTPRSPATLWIMVTARASSKSRGASNVGKPASQHRLAAPRGDRRKEVVNPPGCGDLERTSSGKTDLATSAREIEGRMGGPSISKRYRSKRCRGAGGRPRCLFNCFEGCRLRRVSTPWATAASRPFVAGETMTAGKPSGDLGAPGQMRPETPPHRADWLR